ncbi:MAG: 4a-hydroxytetrahydrobiopterin dehydratase [Halothiobacillaceae bacterium]
MNRTPLMQHHGLTPRGAPNRLSAEQIQDRLGQLHHDWRLSPHGEALVREFRLRHFQQVMLLANMIAWIAEQEDHHPELLLRYNACVVQYQTHDVGGLSEHDFICAAKIDALINL